MTNQKVHGAYKYPDRDMPVMGDAHRDFETQAIGLFRRYVVEHPGCRLKFQNGTGIMVMHDGHGRAFKIEISQVDGTL